jgi:16S rRNA (guanine527-N7)-methyltransferase
MNFKEDLINELGIILSAEQENQLLLYYNELIDYNKHTNLTRITDYNEVNYKHFFDSITLVKDINFEEITSLCDMGSGAGFPSIPLKIIYKHLEITIIDSLNKRIVFLEQLIKKLGLTNVFLYHDRIENFALKHQKTYDLVTARALGNLSLISEMGLPMVKTNSYFIAMKSTNYDEELRNATHAISQLGGKIINIRQFELPHEFGSRTNIKIQKIKYIPGYPRNFVTMSNKPL